MFGHCDDCCTHLKIILFYAIPDSTSIFWRNVTWPCTCGSQISIRTNDEKKHRHNRHNIDNFLQQLIEGRCISDHFCWHIGQCFTHIPHILQNVCVCVRVCACACACACVCVCARVLSRNNMPDGERLRAKLRRSRGRRAYACQCSWFCALTLVDLGQQHQLRWVCGKHPAWEGLRATQTENSRPILFLHSVVEFFNSWKGLCHSVFWDPVCVWMVSTFLLFKILVSLHVQLLDSIILCCVRP